MKRPTECDKCSSHEHVADAYQDSQLQPYKGLWKLDAASKHPVNFTAAVVSWAWGMTGGITLSDSMHHEDHARVKSATITDTLTDW